MCLCFEFFEEGGYDINVKQDLIRRGQNVKERTPYSDLQMLYINSSGLISGASDVRTGGAFGGL